MRKYSNKEIEMFAQDLYTKIICTHSIKNAKKILRLTIKKIKQEIERRK